MPKVPEVIGPTGEGRYFRARSFPERISALSSYLRKLIGSILGSKKPFESDPITAAEDPFLAEKESPFQLPPLPDPTPVSQLGLIVDGWLRQRPGEPPATATRGTVSAPLSPPSSFSNLEEEAELPESRPVDVDRIPEELRPGIEEWLGSQAESSTGMHEVPPDEIVRVAEELERKQREK